MKWREKREPYQWYTGPEEGRRISYARYRGVTYEVQAAWRDPIQRGGGIVWWLTSSGGDNEGFRTKGAAIDEAERRASRERGTPQ